MTAGLRAARQAPRRTETWVSLPGTARRVARRRVVQAAWQVMVATAGQADRDVEAAGGNRGGVDGSVVQGRDRRYERETETEPLVPSAIVEASEREEEPFDLVGGNDAPGVDDPDQGCAVVGGGRDRDGAPGNVVLLGVVEQVRDETLEQDAVAANRCLIECAEGGDARWYTGVECVLGDRGEVEGTGRS
jgi:hypothetical protein